MVQLILGIILAALATNAHAITYYVATNGSDINTCTAARDAATPKLTLAGGQGCLVGGDTLIVKAGTYSSQEILNPPAGSDSAYTVIMGDPSGPRPVLSPTWSKRGVNCSNGASCHHIEIRHFEIASPYECMKLFGVDTIGYSHHVRYLDNYCHDTKASGILISSSYRGFIGGDHLIQDNEFGVIGAGVPGYLSGMNTIYNPGNRSIVERNVFHDASHGVGIWKCQGPDNLQPCGQTPHQIQNVIVRNNIFYRMGRTDLNTWSAGANMYSAIHVSTTGGGHRIHNNIIYDSGNTSLFRGIILAARGDRAGTVLNQVYNNTIYNIISPSAYGIYIRQDPTEGVVHVIANNIVYQAGAGMLTTGHTAISNLTTNPSFVDSVSSNFSLLQGSAAINAGTNIGYPFNGTAPDIGAYETIPSPTCTIATNKITCIFPMNTAVPVQGLSVTGVTVGCTGIACPGSPTVGGVTRAGGTDTHVGITIDGIAGNACVAANQTWTISYNSTVGTWTGHDNIGTPPGLNQKVFSFTSLPVTNLCTGSSPPPPVGGPHFYYRFNEGTGTIANDETANNIDCTLTNGPTWVAGKTGTALKFAAGTLQHCAIPWGSGVNPSTQSLTIFVPVFVPAGLESATHYIMGPDPGTNQRGYICGHNGVWKVAVQSTSCASTPTSNLSITSGWNVLTLRFDSGTDIATLYKGTLAGTGGASRPYGSYTFVSNFKLGLIELIPASGVTIDEVQVFLSLQDIAELVSAFEGSVPPPASGTLAQTAVQFQAPYLYSGNPQNFGVLSTVQPVMAGGAVAIVYQIHCQNIADCDATAFKLVYRKNGSGAYIPVPNTETADGIWMWVTPDSNLNSAVTTQRLTGSCVITNGSTQLTADQTPSVDLPQDGCVMLRYIVRVGNVSGSFFETRLQTESGLALAGGYVDATLNVIGSQAGGVGF